MRANSRLAVSVFFLGGLAAATAAHAAVSLPGQVTGFHVASVRDAFGGEVPHGASGPYQLITATVDGTLDPAAPANAGIVDLDKAPRDAQGQVAYHTDVVLLRPKLPRDARRVLVYEVVNRGGLLGKGTFIGGGDLLNGAVPDAGFPSWLEHGYTMVWSGWQADIPMSHGGLRLGTHFPVAQQRGRPVTGMSREEYIPDNAGGAHAFRLSWPPADAKDRGNVTFTARETWRDAKGRAVYDGASAPVTQWHYTYGDQGQAGVDFTPPAQVPGPDGRPMAPDAGTIYTFTYRATGSQVAGIGFAAVRDLVTFLRHHGSAAAGVKNPLDDMVEAKCALAHCAARPAGNVDVAIGVGISQSGRFLRDFLYGGFNDDGRGQRVFDGLMPIIAGARRTWVNARFAQPGRWSKQHEDHFMPGFQFPFAYNVITDPVSGRHDGLLKTCLRTATCPKIMQVDGSFEWWNGAASLVVTNGAGKDLALPDNVRYYLVPGTGHGGGGGVKQGLPAQPNPVCQFADSPINEAPFERALFGRLVDWVTKDAPPPASRYPTVAAGNLVAPAKVGFPSLHAVAVPGGDGTSQLLSVDFRGRHNPVFLTSFSDGVPAVDVTHRYTVLEPTVDATGNEVAGIRTPSVAVPLASYAGWNLRSAGHAEGELCISHGAMLPLATTTAMHSVHDPRPALQQLYRDRTDYLRKVDAAAAQLVRNGYLLPRDAHALYEEPAAEVSSRLLGDTPEHAH